MDFETIPDKEKDPFLDSEMAVLSNLTLVYRTLQDTKPTHPLNFPVRHAQYRITRRIPPAYISRDQPLPGPKDVLLTQQHPQDECTETARQALHLNLTLYERFVNKTDNSVKTNTYWYEFLQSQELHPQF
jgi:hypothetical protein